MAKGTDNVHHMIAGSLGFLDNYYIKLFIVILLVIYISSVVPWLTADVSKIFDNMIVKLLFVLIIAYISVKDPTIAILLAIAYAMSVNTVSKQRMMDVVAPPPFEQLNAGTANMPQMVAGEEMHNSNNSNNSNSDNNRDNRVNSGMIGGETSEETLPNNRRMMGRRNNMNGGVRQNNMVETLDGSGGSGEPLGYSNGINCLNTLANGGGGGDSDSLSAPCAAVATYQGEFNAQGMNFPMGNPGKMNGAQYAM